MTPFLAPLFDFNPEPLQPGQNAWRDAAGHDRAIKFATDLTPTDKPGTVSLMEFDGHFTDLEAALASLQPKNNGAAASEIKHASRAEAATTLLAALDPYQLVLEELRTASHRPYARFNIEYNARNPMSILLPHYYVLQNVSKLLRLRVSAELVVRKNDRAFEDVKLMFYLVNSISAEPFLISLEVRGRMLKMIDQLIWEGLAQREWTDQQLRELQDYLASIELLKG